MAGDIKSIPQTLADYAGYASMAVMLPHRALQLAEDVYRFAAKIPKPTPYKIGNFSQKTTIALSLASLPMVVSHALPAIEHLASGQYTWDDIYALSAALFLGANLATSFFNPKSRLVAGVKLATFVGSVAMDVAGVVTAKTKEDFWTQLVMAVLFNSERGGPARAVVKGGYDLVTNHLLSRSDYPRFATIPNLAAGLLAGVFWSGAAYGADLGDGASLQLARATVGLLPILVKLLGDEFASRVPPSARLSPTQLARILVEWGEAQNFHLDWGQKSYWVRALVDIACAQQGPYRNVIKPLLNRLAKSTDEEQKKLFTWITLQLSRRRPLWVRFNSFTGWLRDLEGAGRTRYNFYEESVEPIACGRLGQITSRNIELISTLPDGHFLLYYLSHSSQVRSGIRSQALGYIERGRREGKWPLHPLGLKLASGEKRALVLHLYKDYFGDEMVRVVPWVRALLAHNPFMRVTVVTKRPGLYDPDRVDIISHEELASGKVIDGKDYDLVIERSAAQFEMDEMRIGIPFGGIEGLRPDVARIVMKSVNFHEVVWKGKSYSEAELGLDCTRSDYDMYGAARRLISAIGLPVQEGPDIHLDSLPFVGLRNHAAHAYWDTHVLSRAAGRKIILLHPFGGQLPGKGFVPLKDTLSEPQYSYEQLLAMIRKWTQAGPLVVVSPNATQAGSSYRHWGRGEWILSELGPVQRESMLVLPQPQEMPPGMINLASLLADINVPVEGGQGQFVSQTGRPLAVLRMRASGGPSWLPATLGPFQRMMTPFEAEEGVLQMLRDLERYGYR